MNLIDMLWSTIAGGLQLLQASHPTVILVSKLSLNFITKYEASAHVIH